MNEETKRPRMRAAQLRPVLPVAAVLLALVAAWLAWGGWQQQRDAQESAALERARDSAARGTGTALDAATRRLQARLAAPEVQAALAQGDLEAASAQLAQGWPEAEAAGILPEDLGAEYGDLAGGGYGRLAVMEGALAADEALAGIARDAGGPRLLVAAPARAGDRRMGVAWARLPLSAATAPLAGVALDESAGYLALRQGSHTVLERGVPELARGAEKRAVPVPGTGFRIVAAGTEAGAGPLGLASGVAFILAAVLAALAVAALLAWRRMGAAGADADEGVAEDLPPTLAETLRDAPAPAPAEPAAPAETAAAGDVPVGEGAVAAPVAPAALAAAGGGVAIDRSIFRAYDIRGVVGSTLDRGVAELIGQAIGSLMHEKGLKEIVVGRDGRLSGPEMAGGLVAGLRRAGRDVIDIGLAPTPVVYFGAFHLRAGSCVSVTGSHNPPDYNGFKVVVGGETLSGDAITDLFARIADDRLHEAPRAGDLQHRDINDAYVERIASDVQLDRPLKVVVDAGNGVAGEVGPRVLAAVGAEVTPLYCEIDGTFPNHHPDPSEPHNLEDLTRMVERLGADLGIAFDGDGDRLGVVTPAGRNIFPDRLLMLFAADVLERNPGAVIVYDVKCTGHLPGQILRHGGSPLMWKTGHSLIKAKMRETEAELAGEMSGHFFFKERWFGFDDGIYAAARLLEILATRNNTPDEVFDALPDSVSTPEIKVPAPADDPHGFVARFQAQSSFEGARLSTIDGVRVDWKDGWGLVRASNTTPVLVMRFDGDDAAALARIQDEFKRQLLAIEPSLALPF
ncbi:phosphomannomutase/phosphoglucomutase [Luteimonas pelagia]